MVMFKRSASMRNQASSPMYHSTMNRNYSVSTSYPSTYEQQWMPQQQQQSPQKPSGFKVGVLFFFLILPWIPYAAVRMNFNTSERNIQSLLDQRLDMVNEMMEMTLSRRRLQEQEKKIHDETDTLYAKLRSSVGPLADSEEYEQVEKLEEGLLNQIDNMHDFIQSKFRIAVKEKYGRKKRRIAFDVDYINDVRSSKSTFVVELADARSMPHSVHLFLDMVSEKLWDGHTLSRHSDGGLKASPGDSLKSKTLLFLEQSDDQIAAIDNKYSLCFSGAGPGFYFSVEPTNPVDSCFGTVVDDNSLLDRLSLLPKSTTMLSIRLLHDE